MAVTMVVTYEARRLNLMTIFRRRRLSAASFPLRASEHAGQPSKILEDSQRKTTSTLTTPIFYLLLGRGMGRRRRIYFPILIRGDSLGSEHLSLPHPEDRQTAKTGWCHAFDSFSL